MIIDTIEKIDMLIMLDDLLKVNYDLNEALKKINNSGFSIKINHGDIYYMSLETDAHEERKEREKKEKRKKIKKQLKTELSNFQLMILKVVLISKN